MVFRGVQVPKGSSDGADAASSPKPAASATMRNRESGNTNLLLDQGGGKADRVVALAGEIGHLGKTPGLLTKLVDRRAISRLDIGGVQLAGGVFDRLVEPAERGEQLNVDFRGERPFLVRIGGVRLRAKIGQPGVDVDPADRLQKNLTCGVNVLERSGVGVLVPLGKPTAVFAKLDRKPRLLASRQQPRHPHDRVQVRGVDVVVVVGKQPVAAVQQAVERCGYQTKPIEADKLLKYLAMRVASKLEKKSRNTPPAAAKQVVGSTVAAETVAKVAVETQQTVAPVETVTVRTPVEPEVELASAAPEVDSGEPIESTLPTDQPIYAEIVAEFVDYVRDMVESMDGLLAKQDFSEIRNMAHSLKGSGGSAGFPAFTKPSKELEVAAENESVRECQQCIETLRNLANRVQVPTVTS